MKKIIVSIIIILVFGVLVYYRFQAALITPQNQSVIITNSDGEKIVINVDLAETPAAQTQGLSGREKLDPGHGMLFVFLDKKNRSFWMKDMNFPIDIIWINDLNIVNISKNLPPEGEWPKNHYSPGMPVNYVLEVPAGFCQENKIQSGGKVFYNF